MFQFLHDMDGLETTWQDQQFNIGGQQLNIQAYTEVGLGLSRQINNRLTVGARVKALLGIGNMEMKINKAYMNAVLPSNARMQEFEHMQITDIAQINQLKNEIGNYRAELAVGASLESSFKGLNLVQEEGQDYISDFDFDAGDMGIMVLVSIWVPHIRLWIT